MLTEPDFSQISVKASTKDFQTVSEVADFLVHERHITNGEIRGDKGRGGLTGD